MLYTQPLSLDEEYYTFAIPEGTTTISLIQKEIGTKSKGFHRISFQQAYLYTGDYQCNEVHIDGSPFILSTTSYSIQHNQPLGTTIYYRVTPEGLRTSNTIAVAQQTTTALPNIITPDHKAKKLLHNGQLIILLGNKKYNALGQVYDK